MKSKTLHRIGFISSNTIRQIVVSVVGMAIPFMVIQNSSKVIWGEFVSVLLFSLLALQIINWGNKEYLLREFSQSPNKIKADFLRVLFTRFPLVIAFSVIAIFYFDFGASLFLLLLGRYLIHSFEVLVVFEKKFNASLFIELVTFLIFCLAFYYFKESIDVYFLVLIYSGYQLLKGIGYCLLFNTLLSFNKTTFDVSYFKAGFWFFLLSLFGFLASKIDVYIIERFGNKIMTSDYQIINSLLVFTMSTATFVYGPFTKNIYRNNHEIIQKAKKIMALLGVCIVPLSLVGIYCINHYFLEVSVSFWFYIIAFFYVYPSFIYGIDIVNLFKQHQEKKVVMLLLIGTVCNFILTVAFLNLNFGIISALLGSAIAQIVVLILFKLKSLHYEKI